MDIIKRQGSEFVTINGQEVDVTTVMNKDVSYVPTDEEIEKVKAGYRKHLNEYFPGLLSKERGLDVMFNKRGDFWDNKGWIISAFKKHPNYNGNLQIVLRDTTIRRGINAEDAEKFFNFCKNNLKREKYYMDQKGNKVTEEEVRRICGRLDAEEATACRLYHRWRRSNKPDLREKAVNLVERLREIRTEICKARWTFEQEDDALDYLYYFVRNTGAEAQFIDEECATRINVIFNDERFTCKGQKTTKLIGKIAKRCGLTKVVDLQDHSFTTQTGEVVTRQKDYGWNYQFALVGDALNPMNVKATAIISVNPVDFLRMSFGHKWASCMTTDKENRRHADNNYHGMYCGGVESYMLDDSTFLVYYLPAEWNGNEPEWEDKLKRCNFHIGQDKIVQGRVYPDGRDGGDPTLSTDMRNLVQKVISDIFGEPNYWTVKKGTDACGSVVYSEGSHYRDYTCYGDCTVSYWKRIDGYQNEHRFTIGHDSVCPECGEYHCWDENIFCEYCTDEREIYHCTHCGDRIDEDDVVWVDGEPYCSDCVSWCEDCEEYVVYDEITRTYNDRYVCNHCLNERYTWCDDVNEYVYDDDVIETEEGNHYHVDSYEDWGDCEECGEHHDRDSLIYDEETDAYYCQSCYEHLIESRAEVSEAS